MKISDLRSKRTILNGKKTAKIGVNTSPESVIPEMYRNTEKNDGQFPAKKTR
jgi:hypothetical protein